MQNDREINFGDDERDLDRVQLDGALGGAKEQKSSCC